MPNTLKAKVGSGGLSEDILNKAQALLENNTVDFQPLAEMYLTALMKGIDIAKGGADHIDNLAAAHRKCNSSRQAGIKRHVRPAVTFVTDRNWTVHNAGGIQTRHPTTLGAPCGPMATPCAYGRLHTQLLEQSAIAVTNCQFIT